MQNLQYSNGVLTGNFVLYYEGELLTQDYPAKLYILGGLDKIEICSFTIKPTTNKNVGSFVSSPKVIELLEEARNNETYRITFIVKANAFPNISYAFTRVLSPIDCPDEDFKYRQIITVGEWDAIKDNICCNCYSQPYTGTQIIWDGKPCSKNGTTC